MLALLLSATINVDTYGMSPCTAFILNINHFANLTTANSRNCQARWHNCRKTIVQHLWMGTKIRGSFGEIM